MTTSVFRTAIPHEGYFSEAEQNWLLRPATEWKLRDDAWLDVGGPGVDGISFALRKEVDGVFAYYPIERTFVWKARDGASLITGWLAGTITV